MNLTMMIHVVIGMMGNKVNFQEGMFMTDKVFQSYDGCGDVSGSYRGPSRPESKVFASGYECL